MKRRPALPLALSLALSLGACASLDRADPGKYAAYECEELDALAESYRPDYTEQLFADSDITEFERNIESGGAQRAGDSTSVQRPYEARMAAERRSIAAARRLKKCP